MAYLQAFYNVYNTILLTLCLIHDIILNEGTSALFHRPAMGDRPTGHDREVARGELFDQVDTIDTKPE